LKTSNFDPPTLSSPAVRSKTAAVPALRLTDSIPLKQLAFSSYPWLAAIISPFGATSLNLNSPILSLKTSNFGSTS
jgi:hypothetical protein